MIALRIFGHAGPAQRHPRGHRVMIEPKPFERRSLERCGECPSCRSDLAEIVPCMRRGSRGQG